MAEQALSSSEKTWSCSCTHSSVHSLFLGSITQQDISAVGQLSPGLLGVSLACIICGSSPWRLHSVSCGWEFCSILPSTWGAWVARKAKGDPSAAHSSNQTWEWGCSNEVSIKHKDTQPCHLSGAGFLREFMAELSGCSWCSAPLDLEPVGAARDLPVLDISLWMLWEYAPLKEIHLKHPFCDFLFFCLLI